MGDKKDKKNKKNKNSGLSTGQKVALGGAAAIALAGVAAVGTTAVGVGGYKIYKSQQGQDQDKSPMKLYAHVHSARNLQAADKKGTSDPYCVLTQGHVSIKTKPISKNLNPVWDERLEMGVYEKDLMAGELQVQVYDKDMLADDSLGSVRIPLSTIPHGTPKEFNLNLTGGSKKSNNGVVKMYLHFGPAQGGHPPQGGFSQQGHPQQGFPPQGQPYPQQGGYPSQQGYPPNPYGSQPQRDVQGYPPSSPYGSQAHPQNPYGGGSAPYGSQPPQNPYGSQVPPQGSPYGSQTP